VWRVPLQRWDDRSCRVQPCLAFERATLHVRRAKKGTPATHPIRGDELRALRKLQRAQEPKSAFVFTSERGAPFGPTGFARMIERLGAAAKLTMKVHPHMLRHACGYALVNKGRDTRALQAYLGHRNIQHTVSLARRSLRALSPVLSQTLPRTCSVDASGIRTSPVSEQSTRREWS
jgi:integrase